MVKIENIRNQKGRTMYMDGFLKDNLDDIKPFIKKDMDFSFIVCGRERVGKSLFTMQVARYLDENFNLSNICFSLDDFENKVLSAEPYSAIVFDEVFSSAQSTGFMGDEYKRLNNLLVQCGQRNLFLFLVLPDFYDLGRYFSLHRGWGLFYCHFDNDLNRGFFRYYDRVFMKEMYLYRRQSRSYPSKCSFKGRFTHFYPLPILEHQYRKKKAEMLQRIKKEDKKGKSVTQLVAQGRREVMKALLDELKTKGEIRIRYKKELQKLLGVAKTTLWRGERS